MEQTTEPTLDPFSEMIDLAIFHLRKETKDSNLQGNIEKLGFKIAIFDDTDMMVTIKHPSASVIRKFLKVMRESDTANSISQLQSSSQVGKKIVEPTNPEAITISGVEGDEKSTSLLNDVDRGNGMKNLSCIENGSQEEMLTRPRDNTCPISVRNDGSSKREGLWDEERTSSSKIHRCIDQKDPEYDIPGLSRSKEHFKIMKREQKIQNNDPKAFIFNEAEQRKSFLNLSPSDKEKAEPEVIVLNGKQEEQINIHSYRRGNGISSPIIPSDSQPGSLDTEPKMLHSGQGKSFFYQKIPKTPAFPIHEELTYNGRSTCVVRWKEKSLSLEEQVCDQSYSSLPLCKKGEVREEHHVNKKETGQASNSYHPSDHDKSDLVPSSRDDDFQKDSNRKSTFWEGYATSNICVGGQNIKMDKNQSTSLGKSLDPYPNLGDTVASGKLTGKQPFTSSSFSLLNEDKDSRRKSRYEEDAARTESCAGDQDINMDENHALEKSQGHNPSLEFTIASGNPSGSLPSSSQNIDDVRKENYELMRLRKPVFRKIAAEFKDSIGTYYVHQSKTHGKMVSVHIKKSHDFERLVEYVKRLESEADLPSNASHGAETDSKNSNVQHMSSVSRDTHTFHYSFENKFQGLTFNVGQADITTISHDVIVCPMDKHLTSCYGMSKAVTDYAGGELKAACKEFISSQKQLGISDVLITPAGKLDADKVFHVGGPFAYAEDLRKSLITCLVLADTRGLQSIAFPIISRLTLVAKEEECFKTILLSVISFDSFCIQNKHLQNLKTITFVDKNSLLVQHFVKFLKENWSQLSTLCSNPKYDVQNSKNECMKEIQTIYKICSKPMSTKFDGFFLKPLSQKGDSHPSPMADEARALDDECPICCDGLASDILSCCNNRLCQDCKARVQRCPFCQKIFQVMRGNQPPGRMTIQKRSSLDLPGHNGCGSYVITYYFREGYQKEGHPNPGTKYNGTTRTAYLPFTKEAEPFITLLILAFIRSLTFTIGTSLTTSRENSVVWNGIHHKTSCKIDRSSYGYPDPHYFTRLLMELSDRGVTKKSMTRDELVQILGYLRLLKTNSSTDIVTGS